MSDKQFGGERLGNEESWKLSQLWLGVERTGAMQGLILCHRQNNYRRSFCNRRGKYTELNDTSLAKRIMLSHRLHARQEMTCAPSLPMTPTAHWFVLIHITTTLFGFQLGPAQVDLLHQHKLKKNCPTCINVRENVSRNLSAIPRGAHSEINLQLVSRPSHLCRHI